MADLLTHACTGLLWRGLRRGPHTGVLVLGTLLPDLLARIPPISLTWARDHGLSVPTALIYAWEPLHLPVGMALVAVLLASFFPAAERRAVAAHLAGGMLLHLLFDLPQDHLGQGYLLLYPFSVRSFELGWVGPEASVLWAGPLSVGTGLVWLARWRQARRERGMGPID